MNKFVLPDGTTNRHQWPKQAIQAIAALERLRFERKELYGIKGGEERATIISTMFGDVENETADTLLNDIGDQFEWSLTKDNADQVYNSVIDALPVAREAMPVDDNRQTPNERAEQIEVNNEAAEAREQERGLLMLEVDRIADELRIKYPWAIADKDKMSGQARAAKNMKLELKQIFPGVKFSVRSESFSMGNAVRVEWDNGPSTKSVDAITDKYQYYIDKCTDDNSAMAKAVGRVLGQSKYVSTQRNISSELKEQVGRDICREYGEEYDTNARIGNRWLSDAVYIALQVDIVGKYTGVKLDNEYIAQFEATQPEPVQPTQTAEGVTVREGTKPGYSEIVFLDKPSEEIRAELKSSGFRWSRHNSCWYGKTDNIPARYLDSSPVDPDDTPTPPKGNKFRTLADKMQNQIDNKLADRQTNTPKRLAQASHARLDGEKLQRTQQALYKLADLCDSGTVPAELQNINSKKQVYDLMATVKEQAPNGYHAYSVCTGKPLHTTPEAIALWSLVDGKTEEQKQAEELQRKIDGLQFSSIPGYFPTPKAVIDLMLEYADIRPEHTGLEPSAGSGAIADTLKPLLSSLDVAEINRTLADILKAKGHNLIEFDFMELASNPLENEHFYYDRILMNPPFENLQDIDHVRHAHDLLNTNGRLVAIMSPGPFYRSDKRSTDFRAWFDSLGAEVIDLPENAFKESGTSIATKLVIIDKDL